jgi:outer membrane biosynthesis protein TonB
LPQHQNSDLHKIPHERNKGIVGATLIHLVALAVLLLFGFSTPPVPEQDEGILVNFGTDMTGMGFIEPSAMDSQEAIPPPLPATPSPSEEEPLLTQNTEEAPVVKKVDPETEKRRLEQIETDRIRRQQIETERVRRAEEEAERKRVEAEQQRQADIINRTKNALAGSKNAGTSSTSEGIAGGAGNQGVPTGSVDSQNRGDGSGLGTKGISYNLEGRGIQRLPLPKYDYQQGGIVVVDVLVDRTGRVVQATPGAKGSTILDDYLLRAAQTAAMEAQFDAKPDAPLNQKGSITYNFILK